MEKTKIIYLGSKGTFSHEALLEFLRFSGMSAEIEGVEKFSLFKEYLGTHKILIPVENSIGGSINTELLLSGALIEAEYFHPIHHAIGSFGEIKFVASHEQPLAQCSNYIRQLGVTEIVTNSTVEGIQLALADKTIGAIGSLKALAEAGLNIIDTNIENNPNNTTRFLLLGNEQKQGQKTSIAFTLPDRAGSLYEILGILADINMTRIESIPTKYELGEYWFFIDMMGYNPAILEKIKQKTIEYKFLGSYSTGCSRLTLDKTE